MLLTKRMNIVSLAQAVQCNPNGNPDEDNRPRIDYETGCSFMTECSINSKLRGYVEGTMAGMSLAGNGCEIMMKHGESINRDIAEAVTQNGTKRIKDVKKFKNNTEGVRQAKEYILQKYWDVRVFGGVLSTGLNAGQVIGPVHIAQPVSFDPVQPMSLAITRKTYTNKTVYGTLEEYEKEDKNKAEDEKRTMGTKKIIPYALFPINASVSPGSAKASGMTEEDFDLLLEAWCNMFDYRPTASKMGMSMLLPIFVFKHVGTHNGNNPEQDDREAFIGCAPDYKIFELLEVHKKGNVEFPRSYKDYDVVFHKSKVPNGVIAGVKSSAFVDIDWDFQGNEWIRID